jgi:hypothetical protein
LRRFETQGRRHFGDSTAGDGRGGRCPADEFRRDENVNLVDRSRVQQAAQQMAAALDHHVGPSAAAHFGQQRV